LLMVC